jgi:SpoVK/Ycf46/Vps4 family AAA+-type ATPase
MGVKIECIFRDSVASWKTENNFEHFMAQGIFKISYGKLDFLHCALFHKGNQNEDEVSFFIVVADDCLRKYIELRNMFEKWLSDRDRDHLEIHVVAGEGIPYKRDMLWEDLFLPENLKAEIRKSVEGFLASRDFYAKNRLPWKRGILLYGTPGCGKSSLIKTIISNYNFKPVTIQSGSQTNDDTITEAFAYAQEQEPALLYLEDLDTLLNQNVSLSHFLQKMDGVSSQNGIMVIATANNIGLLKESVTDRPSRFDRKWEIPLPDAEMSKKYLKKWFGKLLTEKAYNKIVLDTVEKNFSYAYLKELYITSMFNAMAENRTEPSLVDVNAATQQLLNDKETAKNGFEPSNYEAIGINNE